MPGKSTLRQCLGQRPAHRNPSASSHVTPGQAACREGRMMTPERLPRRRGATVLLRGGATACGLPHRLPFISPPRTAVHGLAPTPVSPSGGRKHHGTALGKVPVGSVPGFLLPCLYRQRRSYRRPSAVLIPGRHAQSICSQSLRGQSRGCRHTRVTLFQSLRRHRRYSFTGKTSVSLRTTSYLRCEDSDALL